MRIAKELKKILTQIPITIYALIFIPLLYSIANSGFNFHMDNDEFTHLQQIYLILSGYKPYLDFYSIFSPIFHWFLMPALALSGFTFNAVIYARIFMIILFGIRLIISFYFVWYLFGKRIALLFLPIYLFDPLTIYSSMQVRPDNLMLLFYVGSLTLFLRGISKNSKSLFFLSGVILTLSFLTAMKILPALIVFFLLWLIHFVRTRNMSFLYFLFGSIVTLTSFSLYFTLQGSFLPMIQDVFLDPSSINKMLGPTPFGFFFNFNNTWLFGFIDKPPNWMFIWVIPFFTAIGVFELFKPSLFSRTTRQNTSVADGRTLLKTILYISFLLQNYSLLFVKAVYIQYYLTPNWLTAILAAVGLNGVYISLKDNQSIKKVLVLTTWAIFICLAYVNVQANLNRSRANFSTDRSYLTLRWEQIPEKKPVYPSLLFRPSVYPFITGVILSDIPDSIQKRFPPAIDIIESKQIPYILLKPNFFDRQKPELQSYILENYQRTLGDDELWIRMSR